MRSLGLLFSALLLTSAPPLAAWQDSVTTRKHGPHQLPPVHLSFQVSWDGKINSAKVDFIYGKPDKRYPQYHIAQLYGASTGVAHGLYPYKYNFNSFVRKKDLKPAVFVATEVDRDEQRETTNYFRRSVNSTEITRPHRKGKPTKTKKKSFTFQKAPTWDLLSAFLYLRSLDLRVGDEITLVTHPFTGPYLARIKVLGREVHRGRKCLRLDLGLQKIASTGKLKAYKKMKTAVMWLSDDHERLPIEIRSEVFIGDVRAILVGRRYL